MRFALPLITAAALGTVLGGCNSRSNDTNTPSAAEQQTDAMGPAGGTGAADMGTGAAADATAPMTAQSFVDAAAASDMFEIESSKLAQKMGKSAKVKDFAAMMIKDHTKSSSELKSAAGKATPAVTVAPKLTAEQQSDLDELKGATANFDVMYAQKQAAAHEKALTMLQSYAASGDAAPLKDFAGKTAPVVSGHLEKARDLAK